MILLNKSASADIFKAIRNTLAAALAPLPIYDHIPKDAALPYVQVEAISETEWSTKTVFGSNVQIDITNYAEALESKGVQETTGAIITALDAGLDVEGYNIIGLELIRNECASADANNLYWGTLSFNVWAEQAPAAPALPAAPETTTAQDQPQEAAEAADGAI